MVPRWMELSCSQRLVAGFRNEDAEPQIDPIKREVFTMLSFHVDETRCIRCGHCAADCPVRIISQAEGVPVIPDEKESSCLRCQHCLAVCPTGALSILGVDPDRSRSLRNAFPDPDRLETLIKGRRSFRQYKDENLDPEVLQRILEVALHAPTGHNSRLVRFTVVDDREAMARLREATMEGLAKVAGEGRIPAGWEFMYDFVNLWETHRVDAVYRGAPHLVVASTPLGTLSGPSDCMIALSYLELFAQSLGVGTVWDGIATFTFAHLVPELRKLLSIPEDHNIGYAMAFGPPAVQYARTVEHASPDVVRARL